MNRATLVFATATRDENFGLMRRIGSRVLGPDWRCIGGVDRMREGVEQYPRCVQSITGKFHIKSQQANATFVLYPQLKLTYGETV